MQKYEIELQIFDGQWISEQLSDPDIFYLATMHLDIPSEIYPRRDDEEAWYQTILKKWKGSGHKILNYGEFIEKKSAIRYATTNENLRKDLPFWISILEKYIENEIFPGLKWNAIYEIAVASLKGLNSLFGQEDRLREYFARIPNLENTIDLEDASCLINYCRNGIFRKITNISEKEWIEWRDNLINRVEKLIKSTSNSYYKCSLLYIRGYLSLSIDPKKNKLLSIDDAFKWWGELLTIVTEYPLYPLSPISELLVLFIEILSEHPKYEEFTQ